jgi:hypothetical protein
MHSWGQRKIRLSKSNLEHGDISFFAVQDFFNPNLVGCDSDSKASQKLTAIYHGQAFQTDIDGSQWTLRDRASLVDLLWMLGARAGDDLIIDQIALNVYAFRVKSEPATSPSVPV